MERRQSEREPIEQATIVYQYGVVVAEGVAENISHNGAYLRLCQNLSGGTLSVGSLIEVVIMRPDRDPALSRSFVQVIREDTDGLGVAFVEQKTT